MRRKTTVTEAKKKIMHTAKTVSTASNKQINNERKNETEKKVREHASIHKRNDGDRRWARMNERTKCALHFYREQHFNIEMHAAAERKTSTSFR